MSDSASMTIDDFRARCAAFLDEHAAPMHFTPQEDPRGAKVMDRTKAFQQALADAGLAGVTYPAQFGGMGLGREYEVVWREEAAKRPVMTAQLAISQGMCLPMLNEYGSDEQRAKYQEKLIRADEVWAQMFSEPGAGSDVASLQMKAVRDGDEWILNGQKVWTTNAHLCDRAIVICRTDPEQPKHRGITMFIVDFDQPGVEIRQINQIDGGSRFNEVFFTDVRVPADDQLGPLNEGWRLATAMLMYERVAIGTGMSGGIQHAEADRLISVARRRGLLDDPTLRQDLMRLYSRETTKSLVAMQTRAAAQAGKTPGPGGSLGKLMGANIAAMKRELAPRIVGPGIAAWGSDEQGVKDANWAKESLSTFASGIAGGTNEIQRNIIGERVLGLPREPSVDKDLPFKDLKVGTQSSG